MRNPVEVLTKVRAIVEASEDLPNCDGCLEDALCQVLYQRSWWGRKNPDGAEVAERVILEPEYRLLLGEARRTYLYVNSLYSYNDNVRKVERLALIDRTLDSLTRRETA